MVLTLIRKFFFLLLTFFISLTAIGQPDSCHLRISLLTCSTGEELYSTFGHSALRVTDSVSKEDIVFNYGTFDFSEPGFYTKFIRGNLSFYLSTEDFNDFTKEFQEAHRSMTEQLLNLSCTEKNKIFRLLQINLQGYNKFYKYDFVTNNCTTRLRDLLENAADSNVHFPAASPNATVRTGLHKYLNQNDEQWTKLGMDILLGSRTDVIMHSKLSMFLPDYLLSSFDGTTIDDRPLVLSKSDLYPVAKPGISHEWLTSPAFIFSLLLVLMLVPAFTKNSALQKIVWRIDGLLFFITGITGFMILFMWFGSSYKMCSDNYNIIWALPTHTVAAFYMYSKKNFIRIYFKITMIINILLLCAWLLLPQHLPVVLIPFIVLLIYRSAVHGYGLSILQDGKSKKYFI
ncbi:MAG: DUF4105 domain-containing protein [Chitinophagaceae bacterium]|nr:DUF4105 domain-containing protein [Chitinophagaceae bacterium]